MTTLETRPRVILPKSVARPDLFMLAHRANMLKRTRLGRFYLNLIHWRGNNPRGIGQCVTNDDTEKTHLQNKRKQNEKKRKKRKEVPLLFGVSGPC